MCSPGHFTFFTNPINYDTEGTALRRVRGIPRSGHNPYGQIPHGLRHPSRQADDPPDRPYWRACGNQYKIVWIHDRRRNPIHEQDN